MEKIAISPSEAAEANADYVQTAAEGYAHLLYEHPSATQPYTKPPWQTLHLLV